MFTVIIATEDNYVDFEDSVVFEFDDEEGRDQFFDWLHMQAQLKYTRYLVNA